MSTDLYAVTEGSYSDYRVLALFPTREDAENCLSRGVGDQIEVMDLYESGDDSLRSRPICLAEVVLDTDGSIIDGREWVVRDAADEAEPTSADQIRKQHGGSYAITGRAATPEAARKAARERAAEVAEQVKNGQDPTGRRLVNR